MINLTGRCFFSHKILVRPLSEITDSTIIFSLYLSTYPSGREKIIFQPPQWSNYSDIFKEVHSDNFLCQYDKGQVLVSHVKRAYNIFPNLMNFVFSGNGFIRQRQKSIKYVYSLQTKVSESCKMRWIKQRDIINCFIIPLQCSHRRNISDIKTVL